jgi:hypothetical protein
MAHIYINEVELFEEAINKFIKAVDQRKIDCWGEDPKGEDYDDMLHDLHLDPRDMIEVFNAFMEFVKNGYNLR